MFHGRTAAQIFVTPQDEDPDFLRVLDRLSWCFQQTRGPVVFSVFGAQWDGLYTAIGEHLDRGLSQYGVYDFRQYSGPASQKVIKPFQQRYPTVWEEQRHCTGNSQFKSQILHDKKFVFNAPVDNYKPAVGDYDTIEQAFEAGACVSWFGSLNISAEAPDQSNTVCLMPGIVVATMFCTDILANRAWILQHQQTKQPYPRTG